MIMFHLILFIKEGKNESFIVRKKAESDEILTMCQIFLPIKIFSTKLFVDKVTNRDLTTKLKLSQVAKIRYDLKT